MQACHARRSASAPKGKWDPNSIWTKETASIGDWWRNIIIELTFRLLRRPSGRCASLFVRNARLKHQSYKKTIDITCWVRASIVNVLSLLPWPVAEHRGQADGSSRRNQLTLHPKKGQLSNMRILETTSTLPPRDLYFRCIVFLDWHEDLNAEA